MSETKINFFNKLKNTAINKFSSVPDITGQTVEDFYVEKRMEIPSGEADIYLCSGMENHAGKKFILKYYRRENAVKPEVIAKLRSISSPYVAPVSGFGEFQGHQYTIRPYYEFPALSDVLSAGTRFSENELKTYIIPSAIEGLKVVHDAGILHRDLKPGNLIPDDKGEHVVLIDFGISSNSDGVTFVMTQPGMTPFYAAPEAIQGIYHRETDYYALGITIFELFTGYTPFQNPDISGEEAAKLAAISKIEFPDNFPENLRKLVIGLTYKDISHRNEKDNPNRRWGYDEVKRWLNGENVPVPGELTGTSGAESVKQSAFQPYRFNGKTYTEEKELLLAMLQQPDEALKDLGRGILTHHYFILDEKKGTLCSSTENKIGKNSPENIRHFSKLIYSLRPDIKEIMFNGRMLNSIHEVGKVIIDTVIKEAVKTGNLQSNNSSLINPVKQFALSGVPEDYASIVLKSSEYAKIFANVRKLWSEKEKSIYTDTELAIVLGYSICDDRRIPVHGKVYDSPEIFRQEMKQFAEKDRKAYTEFTQKAKADLDFLEKKLPDTDSRKALNEALADSKWAVFGDNEYLFKNGEDFENFIDKLVQEEKTYELQSLLYRYRTPLKDISKKVWNTDSRTKLEKIVSSFVHVGEHLFTGEESCRKFLSEVLKRGQKEPAYLLGFIKAHKESLDRVVKSPGIKDAVSKLYNSGKNVIALNEHLFPGITEFKNFIDTVTAHGHKDPGYLVDFMRRHKNALKALESNESISNITEPLNKAFAEIISFDNRIFTNVQDFNAHIDSIIKQGENNPRYLVSYTRNHRQEIFDLRNKDNRCHEALNRLMNERNRIVSFDEYVFPTVDEFRSFIDEVLQRGQQDPSYLKRFIRIHEKALTLLNGVSSLTSFVKPVLDAGNEVIELDEYTFSNANDFNSFVSKLSGEDHNKTQRIANFAKEHHDSLITIESNASVATQITNLLKAEDIRVKEKAISVNGVKYNPITMKKGDIIKFGNYPQDSDDIKLPIEWLILDFNKKTNEALLISRYGLDCKQYHNVATNITWEDCNLRKWLNNDFIKSAFSEEDAKKITVSELKNEDNREYRTRGGNDTKDRIFCLSIAEAKQYFSSDEDRQCRPTAYARKHGAYVINGCCVWWLRSPGNNQYGAALVITDGALHLKGHGVNIVDTAFRPALRIILDNEHEQKHREELERKQREELERKQREELERKQREELERKQREELERKQREELERKQQEELERRQREELERRQREELERRQREELERRQREELERKQREELERKQQEELERKQREELERRQLKELQAQTYKDFLAIIKTEIRKGMIIPFGSYPQKENGCRVPIEWLVLDVKKPSLTNRLFYGDKIEALLISRYGLDCKQYHNASGDITWEDCDLRKWLNNDFIKSAFSEEEVKRIKFSELKNEDNHEYGTKGGNDTKDRIFCLSITEAKQYFSSEKDRQCRPTAYARKQGAYVYNDCCYWWLRSPGHYQYYATHVRTDGALHLYGRVYHGDYAVRPALWIICNL